MRIPKSRYKRLEIRDFRGGLNTEQSNPPDNEFPIFNNLILTTDGVRLRGGFQIIADIFGVIAAFYYGNNLYLIKDTGEFGYWDGSTYISVGQINVNIIPKFVYFDPYVCISSGDSLYLYDVNAGSFFQTTSPKADDILVKYGRVVIASNDEVWFSRVGDPTDWTNDANDPSSAQFFQVGYKDGQEIKAISHFLNDILVFKESRIYQLINMESVQLLTTKRGAVNNQSVVSIVSDVYAIDKNGFYSVVKDRFIDLQAGDLDLKVKTLLKENIDEKIRICYAPEIRAFVIFGKNENFMYFYEHQAFSTFETFLPISGFVSGDKLYAFGNALFEYKVDTPYDSFSPYIYGMSTEIASDNDSIYSVQKISGRLKTKTWYLGRSTTLRFGWGLKNITGPGSLRISFGKRTFSDILTNSSFYIADSQDEISAAVMSINGLPKEMVKHKHAYQVLDTGNFYLDFDVPLSVQNLFVDYSIMEV